MVELIPPDDLAIQWDLAVEHRYLEATLAQEGVAADLADKCNENTAKRPISTAETLALC
jgi:hypothetical protein